VVAGAAVLAIVAGFAAARVTDPQPPAAAVPAMPGHVMPGGVAMTAPMTAPVTAEHSHAGGSEVTGVGVGGQGYTLQPGSRSQPPGPAIRYAFQIVDNGGRPVSAFTPVGDALMHLTVVRADLAGYQHLHPTTTGDGRWTTPLALAEPGLYRLVAEFSAIGADNVARPVSLGIDHTVPGGFVPVPLAAPAREAQAGGLTVTMEGTAQLAATVPVLLRVYASGMPVPQRLQPYHGSFGRLLVVRDGDVAVVPAYPEEQLVGGAVKAWLTMPSVGRYRAFFEFQVDGRVNTVGFTVQVS